MKAEIVSIGTELLLGEIIDTNAAKIAKMLRNIGVDLYYKSTVGDNEERIVKVLTMALERAEAVITSGGLGPTVDDVTRQAVAQATGRPLVHSPELEAQIAARFRSFGRTMTDNNKQQAYIPAGAQALPNPVGTAPCFLAEDTGRRGFIISLPGVPHELEYMMTHTVIPLLVERMGGAYIIKARVLRTCAVGESNIDHAIDDLMRLSNPTVGLAAHAGQTDVRITAKAKTEAEADALIAPLEAELRRRLGVAIYGVDNETVPQVIGRLLSERNLTLGIADTLTQGQLAQELLEAGLGHLVVKNLQSNSIVPTQDGAAQATQFAAEVAPADGIGLALVGPFANAQTFIALHGPGDFRHTWAGHGYQATTYRQTWLIIQSLDWLRRTLLGQLTSPVDWQDSRKGAKTQSF